MLVVWGVDSSGGEVAMGLGTPMKILTLPFTHLIARACEKVANKWPTRPFGLLGLKFWLLFNGKFVQ